jgi:hypothetical protein
MGKKHCLTDSITGIGGLKTEGREGESSICTESPSPLQTGGSLTFS